MSETWTWMDQTSKRLQECPEPDFVIMSGKDRHVCTIDARCEYCGEEHSYYGERKSSDARGVGHVFPGTIECDKCNRVFAVPRPAESILITDWDVQIYPYPPSFDEADMLPAATAEQRSYAAYALACTVADVCDVCRLAMPGDHTKRPTENGTRDSSSGKRYHGLEDDAPECGAWNVWNVAGLMGLTEVVWDTVRAMNEQVELWNRYRDRLEQAREAAKQKCWVGETVHGLQTMISELKGLA